MRNYYAKGIKEYEWKEESRNSDHREEGKKAQ